MKQTARFAIVEQFIKDGIKYIFGNPGSTESGLLDALTKYPEIEFILGLHETAVIGMADGYARATKKPAIVQLHAPAGLGNGIGMIYQAYRGHSPLVIIAGSAGIEYDAMDGLLAGNMVEMARPVTKWATRVTCASSLLRIIRRAIKIASTSPMGPVFVELPMDILDVLLDEEVMPSPVLITRVVPDEEPLKEAAKMLLSAQCPLMIIGDGIADSGAQNEVAQAAEIIGAQVWGANCTEVNMSRSHPQFKGLLGFTSGSESMSLLSNADAVLISGTGIMPELFSSTGNIFKSGCKVIHIDLSSYDIGKNYPLDIGIVSDPKLTFARLNVILSAMITNKQRQSARERIVKMAEEKKDFRDSQLKKDEALKNASTVYPATFMRELSECVKDDIIIFDEAITTSSDLIRYLPADKPGHYFLMRGGVLGAGISGAVGLKIANRDKTVIGFAGDGSSLFSIHALWTAAHYGLDTKFVICNNRKYKILKINMLKYWKKINVPEHPFPPSFTINSPAIDFTGLAESFGVPAARIEKNSEIRPGIEKMLNTKGPFLIDLIIEDSY